MSRGPNTRQRSPLPKPGLLDSIHASTCAGLHDRVLIEMMVYLANDRDVVWISRRTL